MSFDISSDIFEEDIYIRYFWSRSLAGCNAFQVYNSQPHLML